MKYLEQDWTGWMTPSFRHTFIFEPDDLDKIFNERRISLLPEITNWLRENCTPYSSILDPRANRYSRPAPYLWSWNIPDRTHTRDIRPSELQSGWISFAIREDAMKFKLVWA